ncbi:PREDICTED: uncharacterized protein LOC109480328 [Branchiostoma belcheri]|uniref:Uncharacterized protein LOC109480328 n=1 Tax=Branchiostoma belcheri TaxID=7741 RepID=A0A6P4ZVP7_BRABE|nr:PREDICTED: uncharacterized protein LOC109480328 [Branchiostoma belcheri]
MMWRSWYIGAGISVYVILLLLSTTAVLASDRWAICAGGRLKQSDIEQRAGHGEDRAYRQKGNTVIFEVDIQRHKMTRQKDKLVAALLTEATAATLRDIAITQNDHRILEWVEGNVSLITVHPAPQFPFGTERGTTVIGYYATFDCSSWTFPGTLLKQVVARSKAQLGEVVGGEVIGDPVLFIRGLSNQRAMNREYFLGMGALSLLALLLLCAGWQGNGEEVKELFLSA